MNDSLNSPAILWFRNDQRLSDNPALVAASKHNSVIPIFIWAPHEETPWEPGAASKWWLHHSLLELDASLKAIGSRLHITTGNSQKTLEDLIQKTGAKALYWNRRYEPSIISRDKEIKKYFSEAGIYVESFNSSLLNEPWEVLKKDGAPYQVYTPYWNAAKKIISAKVSSKIKDFPGFPGKIANSLKVSDLDLTPKIPWDSGFKKQWNPGEEHALKILANFTNKSLSSYNTGRDIPSIPGTSLLSPYLHFGNISPRQVWATVIKKKLNSKDSEQYLKELVWREFAAQLLYHFPKTDSHPLREQFSKFPWRKSKSKLQAWQKGLTGYPIVDAGMRQLWHTGWMHNRVRMIVASFLVKDLQIKWQEGAKWFWDTLVDADLASNTMGWQWTAGCGADAAPYFRIFNPMLQGSRFDPDGAYVKQWIPELKDLPKKWIHAPWDAPRDELDKAGIKLGKDYPKPIVDHFEAKMLALMAYEQIKNKT